jgi:GGDEF domain-containing protein
LTIYDKIDQVGNKMNNPRLSFFLLIAQLTFLFNIERLDLQQANIVNIETYVYILVFSAVVSVIIIPTLWRFKVYYGLTLWLGIYAVVKAYLVWNGSSTITGFSLYITIVEVAMITLSIVLAHSVAVQIHDVEETLKNIFFTSSNSLLRTVSAADTEIQREIYRSRSFGHPLSLVLVDVGDDPVSPELNRITEEFEKSIRNHYVVVSIARAITNILRRTDLLVQNQGSGRFVLLAPETDQNAGNRLAERINNRAQRELGILVKTSVVSFPDDALTFDELVNAAEGRLENQTIGVEHGAINQGQ